MKNEQNLAGWTARPRPGQSIIAGQYVVCEPYTKDIHASELYRAICGTQNDDLWTYMPVGPFADQTAMEEMLGRANPAKPTESSWQTMVIRSAANSQTLGMASYMRIREAYGSAEVGAVTFSHTLQRTPAATEAMYLMARHVFMDLAYRRYEWKCDNANDASKSAALRLGFQFEGVFRNDMVVKGKNRDTAWFAMTDDDWPTLHAGFDAWLNPVNFDADGNQKTRLSELREGEHR